MLLPDRGRWRTQLVVFGCALLAALWILARLTGRSLSAPEVIGLALAVATVIVAFSWARHSGQRIQNAIGTAPSSALNTTSTEAPQRRASEAQFAGISTENLERLTKTAGPPTTLRWCGNDEVLPVKWLQLRKPMVYYALNAPPEDEPSCIDLSLEVSQPMRDLTHGPGVSPSYALLSPAQRAVYLAWLANDRTGPLEHVGFAFLYLCGLERRLLYDCLNRIEIVKEVIRMRAEYGSSTTLGVHLHRFLAFALAQPGFDKAYSQLVPDALTEPPIHYKEDDLALALAVLYEWNIPLPTSWAFAVAQHDRPASLVATNASDGEQLMSRFATRYRERFGRGLKLGASTVERLISYRRVNSSIACRGSSDNSSLGWSITVKDVLGYAHQFKAVAELLAQDSPEQPRARAFSPAKSQPPPRSPPPTAPAPAQPRPTAAPPSSAETTEQPAIAMLDGLAHRIQAASLNKRKAIRWYPARETLSIHGYVIRNPMVYVSAGNPSEAEASCIDLSQNVGKPEWETAPALGRFPTYASMTPDQRRQLHLLAGKKPRPTAARHLLRLTFFLRIKSAAF